MSEKKKSEAIFTPETLKAAGWKKKKDPVFPFEKKIKNRNPLNNSEDSDIKLVLHSLYNQLQFALLLPDGGMVNLNITSFEDIKAFEDKIDFYDPPF